MISAFSVFAREDDIFAGVALDVDINMDKDIKNYVCPVKPEIYLAYNGFQDNKPFGVHCDFSCIYGPSNETSDNYYLGLQTMAGVTGKLRTRSVDFYLTPGLAAGIAFGKLVSTSSYDSFKTKEFFQSYLGFGAEILFCINTPMPFGIGLRTSYFPFCYTSANVKKKNGAKSNIVSHDGKYSFSLVVALKLN